jgi:HpcH/HpaI aldolase/citrate lyase family
MVARNALRRALLYGKILSSRISPTILHCLCSIFQAFDSQMAITEHSVIVLTRMFKSTVPGSSQKFLDKARSLSADCVVYDLEDSVTPHKKADARTLVRRALDRPVPPDIREQAVRINSVASGLALKDLTDVVRNRINALFSDATVEKFTDLYLTNSGAPIPKPIHDCCPQGQLRLRPHVCR